MYPVPFSAWDYRVRAGVRVGDRRRVRVWDRARVRVWDRARVRVRARARARAMVRVRAAYLCISFLRRNATRSARHLVKVRNRNRV